MQKGNGMANEIYEGLKPFDRSDWDAWSGAHGEKPLIGYFPVDDLLKEMGKSDIATLILDTEGVGIYMFDEKGECTLFYILEAIQDYSLIAINKMTLPISLNQIRELGFRNLW